MSNNITKFRRELLVRVAKHFINNEEQEELERIPLSMVPKNTESKRCCIYKERALIKYRIMHLLGHSPKDESDELKTLSKYQEDIPNRKLKQLVPLDLACKSCVKTKYVVTNACQGCFARPCQTNCPKDAIRFIQGKAYIDPEKCINCGKCASECFYHAITHIPVPCMESCPVDAIKRNENGTIEIDDTRCISCGRCVANCPFAAIMAQSDIVEVASRLDKKDLVGIIAPSIMGQFSVGENELHESLIKLGFNKIYLAASGAKETVINEAQELVEKDGELLTSSCCPSYVELVEKHISSLKSHVSHTPSPMIFAAKRAKKENPKAEIVFIGPCIAKKVEAKKSAIVDFVLTFEELGALLVSKEIDVIALEGTKPTDSATPILKGFAESGGVLSAIKDYLGEERASSLCADIINGIDKKSIARLKAYASGKLNTHFLEVMSCNGGCIGGPFNITSMKTASSRIKKILEAEK